ncbi:MAG TPA: hypothetical protein VM509_06680, partial [Planctomycetota bacterium]|nr:hypothetical protein [Planctomycetota bacterium]
MIRSKLFLLVAALVLATLGGRGFAATRVQDDPARMGVRELAERARRASFNAQSAELALEALTEGLDPLLRPAALFALGASRERAMSPRLESWAIEGSAADR